MKVPHLASAIIVITLCSRAIGAMFVPPPTTIPDDVMLTAIAAVETGNDAAKCGRYGERSQLQILPTTWRKFSHLPHASAATNPAETDRVARAYLALIRSRLRARGLPESPFFIAAGWNAGASWRRLRPATVAYAEHVANYVEEIVANSKTNNRSEITDDDHQFAINQAIQCDPRLSIANYSVRGAP